MAAELSAVERAKQAAAYRAVDEYISNGMVVGVGSGSTIVYAVDRLRDRVRAEGLSVTCIPTSFQAEELCVKAGLPLSTLNVFPSIDVAIDGADEVDRALNCIKGGGGCHLREKLVAAYAKQFVVIADSRKQSTALGTVWRKGVPVEVVPLAWLPVSEKLKTLGGTSVLRKGVAKAGPVVTDNGNFILDVDFGSIGDPAALNRDITGIVGVVETGLFCNMACAAYFGREDGGVEMWTPERA